MANDYDHLLRLFGDHLGNYAGSLAHLSPRELYEPENYILSLGGKRVRPLMTLAGCALCGGDPAQALDAALAVELFHNFSLIHDDILDEAPLRRQKQTVHEKFGRNAAILSGDVMLVQSLRALAAYDAPLYRNLSSLLHDTAIQVCEGQQLDMNFESQEAVSVEEYIRMITLKTAVLLGCSLQMGALCAGADSRVQSGLYEFGRHVGIAFQLLDDLLDCFADGNFGKQPGGDIVANKKTFLLLRAYELADGQELALLRQLMSASYTKPDKVQKVTAIFSKLGVDRLCRERADEHTGKAISLLDSLPCDPAGKEQLREFAAGLLNRNA